MGCFTACFNSSKRLKTKLPAATLSQDQNICHDREINEVLQCVYSNDEFKMKDSIAVTSVIKENAEEEKQSSERKKVAYHSDMMKISSSQKQLNLLVDEKKEEINVKDEKTKSAKSKDEEIEATDSSSSSLFTYPPNHRYHNCTTTSEDDESEVTDFDKSKTKSILEENAVGDDINSSDSLFSLSIDSKKEISAGEIMEKEVNSPLKTSSSRRNCIHSVLNPIENLNQWRSVKGKTTALLTVNDQEKENLYQEFNLLHNNEDPILKKSKLHDEIGVDTSFSSWIITSDKCRTNDNSPVSVGNNNSSEKTNLSRSFVEDRPILGSLTLNELKNKESRLSIIDKSLDSNSNKLHRTSSNSEQCKKCTKKVNSTSFQTRIETTLNTGSAET